MGNSTRTLSIIGAGFVGRAVYNSFSPYFDIKIYDKYVKGFNTIEETVNHSEVIFVCVPTPYKPNYEQDLFAIYDVIKSIDRVANTRKIIVIKSTILPGTTRKLSEEFKQFDFVFNPEFLTERTALNDFLNQTRIILGTNDPELDSAVSSVKELYRIRFKSTPILITTFEEAELVKYMCNCYFSTKVIFMNQIYQICEKMGFDYENVRQLFVGDNRITDSHTKIPGFDGKLGYGGKCVLPGSTLLTDENEFYTIKNLYHKYIRHYKMPKVQSCDHTCSKSDFKEIKQVTRRLVTNEELLVFETERGKFVCTKEHLIPVYRDDKLILIQAKDVLITDELIINDAKVYCCKGCGREAKFILGRKPWCVNIVSKCPVMRKKNSDGLKKTMRTEEYHIKRSKIAQEICRTNSYRNNMREKINGLYKDEKLNLKKKVSDGVLRAIKNDPTIPIRVSETHKRNKRNCGDLNGMKKLEARLKVSKSRKKLFEDPNERKKVAVSIAKCWVDGKYDGVKTGRCKWYKYEHSNGKIYKVQGTWELSFIKWLDKNKIIFECHRGRISYYFKGIQRSYYPDFWIVDWDCYVDIKCKQFYNEEKMEAIKEYNKELNFKVLFSEDLKKLGVILNEKTKDFKDIEC